MHAIGFGGTLAWTIDLGADVDGSPAIADDGSIYVGTDAADVASITPRVARQPYASFSQPALEQPGAELPRSYIACTQPASGADVAGAGPTHSSLLSPFGSLAATMQMQTHAVSLAASGGAAFVITNDTLLQQ